LNNSGLGAGLPIEFSKIPWEVRGSKGVLLSPYILVHWKKLYSGPEKGWSLTSGLGTRNSSFTFSSNVQLSRGFPPVN
jgi:hypothetical protein